MSGAPTNVLPGTLDLLILKAVSLGRLHGYGILLRIEEITGGGLAIEQGALYPALNRLERQGYLSGAWERSGHQRRIKSYEITVIGRLRLSEQTASWNRMVTIMGAALRSRRSEV